MPRKACGSCLIVRGSISADVIRITYELRPFDKQI
jgi:hypothetical protein